MPTSMSTSQSMEPDNQDDKLYRQANEILKKKEKDLAYGMFLLATLMLSKGENSDNDQAIKKIANQLSDDKRYQKIFFHGIKSGLEAISLKDYKESIVDGLAMLLLNYSRSNLVTYEQAIFKLQEIINNLNSKHYKFNISDNFFLNETKYGRAQTNNFLYKEKTLERTSDFEGEGGFWKEVYNKMLENNKLIKFPQKVFLPILFAIIAYFTQFRNNEPSNEPSINWSYLIFAFLGIAVFVNRVAAPLLEKILFPEKGAIAANIMKNRASNTLDVFFSSYLSINILALADVLPNFKRQKPRKEDDGESSLVVILTQNKNLKYDEEKLLDYQLKLEAENLYTIQKPKKSKNKSKQEEQPKSILSLINPKPALETLEWKFLGLQIKFLWDTSSKKTWYCDAPTKSYPIQYVSNPQGIKYFCYIPLQTIAKQCDNPQSLTSIKHVAAQPFDYRIRKFTDGIARSVQIIIITNNNEQNENSNPHDMQITHEVILTTPDRGLGTVFKATNSDAKLAFISKFFKDGGHTMSALLKTSFGTVTLVTEDISALRAAPSLRK